MGLALAYHLTRHGVRDVVVLEGQHLAWGASGRNGGGVRAQWSNPMNIALMHESLELCRGFASELGTNIWMRQGGYLFLARDPAIARRLERNVAVQNQHGVATRLLTADEARDVVPELDVAGVTAACYNPNDAVVFPWPFLWGYARAAARGGARIHTFTPVQHIERAGAGFTLVTSRGRVTADRVVNAAGAWSPRVAAMVGCALPTWPARHEILSTEPLRPFLQPMVSELDSGFYASQSLRGEIVGGITRHEPRTSEIHLGSTLGFLHAMSAALVRLLPRLGAVKVVRQWAGPYDMSPDGDPIVGEAPGVPGFFLCCGFVGHGFMMAPVVSRYYASRLTGGPTHELFEAWSPSRASLTDIVSKEDWNIG
jgi:sarcosine oxidase subunit beta